MDPSWLTVLKYLSWILTVGTAFVGSWLFEFTTTDKETGRKSLTLWGRRGVIFAGLALACSLVVTLWTDRDAANRQRETAKRATTDRASSIEYQQTSERRLAEIEKLLTIGLSSPTLSPEAKSAIKQTVASLAGIEDYRKDYPDLYDRLMKATSGEEVTSAIQEGLERAVRARISDASKCASVPRPGNKQYPGGVFMAGDSAALTFIITSDYVRFGFQDPNDLNLGRNGYRFVFADGSESAPLECKSFNKGISCQDTTSQPRAREVYSDLQKKVVAAVKTSAKRYDFSEATAEAVRTTFSCIAP